VTNRLRPCGYCGGIGTHLPGCEVESAEKMISCQELTNRIPLPPDPEAPPAWRTTYSTKDQNFRKKAEFWATGTPEAIADSTKEMAIGVFESMLLAQHMAQSDVAGRSGPNQRLRALEVYVRLVERVLEQVKSLAKEPGKKGK
jgi:hypothetical protein